MQRITVVHIRRGADPNVNQQLQWIGTSLGLFNLRDRDSSRFRIFIALVKGTRHAQPLSSDEIAERLQLSRGTVVHHLTKLMDTGIVVHEKGGYFLREANLSSMIKDIKRDTEAIFAELEEVAKEIDERLI